MLGFSSTCMLYTSVLHTDDRLDFSENPDLFSCATTMQLRHGLNHLEPHGIDSRSWWNLHEVIRSRNGPKRCRQFFFAATVCHRESTCLFDIQNYSRRFPPRYHLLYVDLDSVVADWTCRPCLTADENPRKCARRS